MFIKCYGLKLRLVYTKEDIELLRKWRNSEELSQYMHITTHITKEEQEKWFHSINDMNNFFFIAEYNNVDIGYVFLKNIDYPQSTADPGTFITDKKYMESELGVVMILSILDFAYFVLGIQEFIGRVLKNNKRAMKNYQMFGATFVESNREDSFTIMPASENYNYRKYSEKVRNMVKNLTGQDGTIRIRLNENDFIYKPDTVSLLTKKYNKLSPELKKSIEMNI